MSLQELGGRIKDVRRRIENRVGPWIGAILLVAVVHFLAQLASQFHWSAELAVTLFFAVWGMALLIGWKRKLYVGQYPTSLLFGLWLCTVILTVEVFASLTSFLNAYQPDAFTGSAIPTRFVFVKFYLYHLVDSLPGLKLWDTFSVPPFPYRQQSIAAGLLLLVFRSLVLATLVSALKDWISSKHTSTPETPDTPPTLAA